MFVLSEKMETRNQHKQRGTQGLKIFRLEFVSHHKMQLDRRVRMKARADNLERLAPRIKKIIAHLNRIPNPYQHEEWSLYQIVEEEKQ